ncbi:MAG: hypothetical protein ACYC1K_02130 [Minisyncoccota bacterium]
MNTFKSSLIVAAFFLSIALVIYGVYVGVIKVRESYFTPKGSLIEEVNELLRPASPPEGTPTIMPIVDLEPLKDQPIFRNARVGDTLLIYNEAKRAILYRQSENRIIENIPF